MWQSLSLLSDAYAPGHGYHDCSDGEGGSPLQELRIVLGVTATPLHCTEHPVRITSSYARRLAAVHASCRQVIVFAIVAEDLQMHTWL